MMPRTTPLFIFMTFFLLLITLAHAGYRAGEDTYDSKDYTKAFKEWQPLAEQDQAMAQFNLGVRYLTGQGVPQDYKEAAHWFQLAAEQGYAKAQYNLGRQYNTSQGVQQDYAQARNWWLKAAAQGHAKAQLSLGTLYALGQGVPQDFVQAHMWVNIAAQGLENSVKARDLLIKIMTPEQIAEAQRLARQWLAQHQQ
jgi:TPR repeat protein